jgi:nitrous oxide reductase
MGGGFGVFHQVAGFTHAFVCAGDDAVPLPNDCPVEA